jgi:hypothetical protein
MTFVSRSPTCLEHMRQLYSGLQVEIQPLYLHSDQITAKRLFSLMQLTAAAQMPLDGRSLLAKMRKINLEGSRFDNLKEQVAELNLNSVQSQIVQIALDTLDSFVDHDASDWNVTEYFRPGQLVLVDLSVVFMRCTYLTFLVCLDPTLTWIERRLAFSSSLSWSFSSSKPLPCPAK